MLHQLPVSRRSAGADLFTRSTNGGRSFEKAYHLSPAYNSSQNPGRQGCAVRTDSRGNVYATWEDTVKKQSVFQMAVSTDGGKTFSKARTVADVVDVGAYDGVRSISFDGIAGARTSSFPSLDIANGAPAGNGPDTLAIGWSDGADGLNHEHALVQLSANGGRSWTTPKRVEQSGDRPDFAFIGISPDGTDLYTVYDGFLDPFRYDTTSTRRFRGVLRHSEVAGTKLSGTTTSYRGAIGDARASSANSLIDEFLGDYNTVDATNDGAVAVFNDARNAAVCPAMNAYRRDVFDAGGTGGIGEVDERDEEPLAEGDAPAPAQDCRRPSATPTSGRQSARIQRPNPSSQELRPALMRGKVGHGRGRVGGGRRGHRSRIQRNVGQRRYGRTRRRARHAGHRGRADIGRPRDDGFNRLRRGRGDRADDVFGAAVLGSAADGSDSAGEVG